MYTTTADRVELVYTGLLTHASKAPNATYDGAHQWVKVGTGGLGTTSHMVTVSARGLTGREMAKVQMAKDVGHDPMVDAIYNTIGTAAHVSGGKLESLNALCWSAAVALWGALSSMANGDEPEAWAARVFSGDDAEPEAD